MLKTERLFETNEGQLVRLYETWIKNNNNIDIVSVINIDNYIIITYEENEYV